MAASNAPRMCWRRAHSLAGDGVMTARTYLDLKPMELLGRRYVLWGFSLSAAPPLLTSCHFGDYLCQARWDGDVSPVVSAWALFPWLVPIALSVLGGLGMAVLGGILLLSGRHATRCAIDPVPTAAFRICAGSLIAILLIGGLGYVAYDAISPGFYYAAAAAERKAWLISQA